MYHVFYSLQETFKWDTCEIKKCIYIKCGPLKTEYGNVTRNHAGGFKRQILLSSNLRWVSFESFHPCHQIFIHQNMNCRKDLWCSIIICEGCMFTCFQPWPWRWLTPAPRTERGAPRPRWPSALTRSPWSQTTLTWAGGPRGNNWKLSLADQ